MTAENDATGCFRLAANRIIGHCLTIFWPHGLDWLIASTYLSVTTFALLCVCRRVSHCPRQLVGFLVCHWYRSVRLGRPLSIASCVTLWSRSLRSLLGSYNVLPGSRIQEPSRLVETERPDVLVLIYQFHFNDVTFLIFFSESCSSTVVFFALFSIDNNTSHLDSKWHGIICF